MRRALAVLGLASVPLAAGADEVFLRGGGVIRGEIVAENRDSLTVEVGPGRLTLPRARVERVVLSTSDLAVYRQRAASLAAQDVRGWLNLARWAEAHDLLTQAHEAYVRAAAADPTSAEAQQGLGRELVDGHWLGEAEANRARGLVEFGGRWVTIAERTAILEAQAAEAQARRADAEAAARIREADARARAAEAEARRLEAEAAQAAEATGGIPLGFPGAYGPFVPPFGGTVVIPVIVRGTPHDRRGHGRPPVSAPPPRPPARDMAARQRSDWTPPAARAGGVQTVDPHAHH